MARQQQAKSALRKKLDERLNYEKKLVGEPEPIDVEHSEGWSEQVWVKPVGSRVKDLYMTECLDRKFSGFKKAFFYRALDANGRRLYRDKGDLMILMDDPEEEFYANFTMSLLEHEGFENFATAEDLSDAEKNSESTPS